MPRGKRKRSNFSKRKRKRSRKRRTRSKAYRNLGGFGVQLPKKIVKLKFVDQVNLDAGVSPLCATQVINANGPFLLLVGSHQPRGFDQLAELYTRYYVKSATLTVQFQNINQGNSMIVGIDKADARTPETNMNEYMEQRSQYKMVGPRDQRKGNVVIRSTFNARKDHN